MCYAAFMYDVAFMCYVAFLPYDPLIYSADFLDYVAFMSFVAVMCYVARTYSVFSAFMRLRSCRIGLSCIMLLLCMTLL